MRFQPLASLLVLVTAIGGGCSAASDDDSSQDGVDAGADEEGYGEYDGPNGTGAGEDDGDGPDDDIPNDEDMTDTALGPYDDLDEEGESLDSEDESGVPDPDDPYLEPDATARFAPAAPALTPGCIAKGTLGGAPAWIFFVRPDAPCHGDPGNDRNAIRELVRLIHSVPKGGRIDAHIFSISIDRVAKELHDAQVKGVTVYLSTDGQVGDSKDVSKTVYLDQLKNKKYCHGSNNRACISTAAKAISHTKLFTFSHATAPDGSEHDNVVWFGSANQSPHSGTKLYNNTVTIYGAEGLYKDLKHYLEDLYNEKRAGDYYKPGSGRGRILRNAANVYASPEAETDLVTHRLDDLAASDGCVVRVMQAVFRDSRLAVVNRLVKMKQGHCDVQVVAHKLEPKAKQRFDDAGIPVRRALIHDKAFIIKGKYGSSTKYRVFTGSHNMSYGADHDFDEIFVKLAPESGSSHPVYDAYMAHFSDAWNHPL
jgi:hypothetical protein